jgi:hypothetical protein
MKLHRAVGDVGPKGRQQLNRRAPSSRHAANSGGRKPFGSGFEGKVSVALHRLVACDCSPRYALSVCDCLPHLPSARGSVPYRMPYVESSRECVLLDFVAAKWSWQGKSPDGILPPEYRTVCKLVLDQARTSRREVRATDVAVKARRLVCGGAKGFRATL